MWWEAQALRASTADALPALAKMSHLVRTVTTPEFAGVTFHEVLAKSALSRVGPGSAVPFTWTINPYRGCSHACVYCFARPSHRYLELGSGADFDSQVIVKINVVEALKADLAKRSWAREHVALGTNTDPYQRAEGRYRLMPGISTRRSRASRPSSAPTGSNAPRGLQYRRDGQHGWRVGAADAACQGA